jgi:hypothetical protein
MQGEVRVTVIATGFDRVETPAIAPVPAAKPAPGVINFPSGKRVAPPPAPVNPPPVSPPPRPDPRRPGAASDVPEMEIPTFIRRQMD